MTADSFATKSSSAVRTLNIKLAALLSAAGRVLTFSLGDDSISLRKGQ